MKYLPILFVFFTLTGCLSQAPETKDPFNLDLEVINQGTPVGWRNNQDYATGYLFPSIQQTYIMENTQSH